MGNGHGMGSVGGEDLGGEATCLAALLGPPTELSTAMLAGLVDDLADAVVVADTEGCILHWNRAATRLFGFTADEALGATLDLIIPERLRTRHWAGYAHAMATGTTRYGERLLEVPAVHRDGRSLSIAFTVTLLLAPGTRIPVGIAAVIRDDTERWQERRQLRAELASMREQLEAATAVGRSEGSG